MGFWTGGGYWGDPVCGGWGRFRIDQGSGTQQDSNKTVILCHIVAVFKTCLFSHGLCVIVIV